MRKEVLEVVEMKQVLTEGQEQDRLGPVGLKLVGDGGYQEGNPQTLFPMLLCRDSRNIYQGQTLVCSTSNFPLGY